MHIHAPKKVQSLTSEGQIQYAFMILTIFAFGFIKLSICFFYRRLFVPTTNTVFDWVTTMSIVIIVLWTFSFTTGFIFSCGTHFSAGWGSVEDYKTYCAVATNLDSPFVVSDLITDVIVLCLPLPVVSAPSTDITYHR